MTGFQCLYIDDTENTGTVYQDDRMVFVKTVCPLIINSGQSSNQCWVLLVQFYQRNLSKLCIFSQKQQQEREKTCIHVMRIDAHVDSLGQAVRSMGSLHEAAARAQPGLGGDGSSASSAACFGSPPAPEITRKPHTNVLICTA